MCRSEGGDQPGDVLFLAEVCRDGAPERRRLKALEGENVRLKKLVAELSFDREMLQDVVRRKL